MGGGHENLVHQYRSQEFTYSWLSSSVAEEPRGPCDNVSGESWTKNYDPSQLAKFSHVKDTDGASIISVDDASSVSDSGYDTNSVLSAHSSWHSSSTSETAETNLDEDDVEASNQAYRSGNGLGTCQRFEEQTAILRGLETKLQHHSTALPHRFHESRSQSTKQQCPTDKHEETHFTSQQTQFNSGVHGFNGTDESISYSKCNRRRSGASSNTAAPPCKLKRDTESTDCFVSLLIIFATRLITAIWPLSACPPMMSTCFNGAGVLPLRVFIQETLRRSKTSYSTLQVALYYLILLKCKLPDSDFTKEQSKDSNGDEKPCRAMQCGRRMFLSALMLASKYLQDRNYSTRAWSKISGLRSVEINENETQYLRSIDYNLHMTKETFENWSKVVLTLSKLSKIRATCDSDDSASPLRKPFNGMGCSLAEMVPPSVDSEIGNGAATFSDQWWNELLKTIEPEMIKDSKLTEDFLRLNIPSDEISEILAPLDHNASSPPTSPESVSDYSPDINFSDALSGRGNQSNHTPLPQSSIKSPSPNDSTTVPFRPQPRNLPTPQSTPRLADSCPWSNGAKLSTLRCSASLDALRTMRRQSLMNASLERCPPPRPQSLVLPPVRNLMRSAEPIQDYSSRSTTPSVSSPASVTSEMPVYSQRSRSSSISSNCSATSASSWTPRGVQVSRSDCQFSSPLSRVSSVPDDALKQVQNRQAHYVPTSSVKISKCLARFSDEGYGSGEDHSFRMSNTHSGEQDAIKALLSMSSGTGERSISCSKGHKRTLSRTNENLHMDVRDSLSFESMVSQVNEDPFPSSHELVSERQWQPPTKRWAAPKKPLSNCLDTKRLAMNCLVQQFTSAPELASQYLKDQIVSA